MFSLTRVIVLKIFIGIILSLSSTSLVLANAVQGEWQGPFCWPSLGTHMIHLHTGKILIWPGHYSESDEIEAWLWEPKPGCYGDNTRDNPDPNCFTRVDNDETNLFCSGHASLANGSFLVTGGHTGGTGSNVGLPDANIFDPKNETWTGSDDGVAKMAEKRWYPTSTTLPDGQILTVSGSNRLCNGGNEDGENCVNHSDCGSHGSCVADICDNGDNVGMACTKNSDCLGVGTCDDIQINAIPEIFNPSTQSWTQLNGAPLGMPFYPLMFVLPDGNIFYAGAEDNYNGTNPTVTTLQNYTLDVSVPQWNFVDLSSIPGGSGVMYEPGKILKVGGGFNPASNGAQVIDLTSTGNGMWKNVASMSAGRVRNNLTLLPDGTALVTGGTRRNNLEYNWFCEGGTRDGRECSLNNLPPGNPGLNCTASNDPSPPNDGCPGGGTCTGGDGAQQWVAEAQLFNPVTETWATMDSMQTPRLYHSTAILLPDGRIIKAGGGQGGGGIHDYTTFEIFKPPYLFKGARPSATSVPQAIGYGHNFSVTTPDASDIQKASLIRLAAATHGFDQNQRYLPLVYQTLANSLTITGASVGGVDTPLNANIAPPGYYMLFLVNNAGVPSIGKYLRISEAPLALCQDVTVQTDPGICTSAASIDNGSFDPKGDNISLSQAPPSPYDLGDTAIILTVTDADGFSDTCSANVTVEDNEPPVFSNIPDPITAEQTSMDGTPVNVPLATATDNCMQVNVVSDAPAIFPLGETTVTFIATDGSGNTAQAAITVTIVDTTPPDIESVTATPNTLWPPNHKLQVVEIAVEVSDICDANPFCQVVSVASDEPVNGPQAGNTTPDWEIVGDFSVNLRAERMGSGDGRTYTVTVQCTDMSGNSATSDVTVEVVHNQ